MSDCISSVAHCINSNVCVLCCRYNYSAGQGHLTSNSLLSLNEWHTIHISHSDNKEELVVDNGHPVMSTSTLHTGTNVDLQTLVIGRNSLATATGIYRGFSGCISNLAINSRPIRLDQSTVLMSGSVENCFATSQCDEEFCLNGGTCIRLADGPVCACSHGFTGSRCEHGKRGTCL